MYLHCHNKSRIFVRDLGVRQPKQFSRRQYTYLCGHSHRRESGSEDAVLRTTTTSTTDFTCLPTPPVKVPSNHGFLDTLGTSTHPHLYLPSSGKIFKAQLVSHRSGMPSSAVNSFFHPSIPKVTVYHSDTSAYLPLSLKIRSSLRARILPHSFAAPASHNRLNRLDSTPSF